MNTLCVGVLRGGDTYIEESLLSGKHILNVLKKMGHEPIDILVDKDGIFYTGGLPITLHKLSHKVDVVWNALHGGFGEDGTISKMLDDAHIPHTGSTVLGGALSLHKVHAKERAKSLGFKTAPHVVIPFVPFKNIDDCRKKAQELAVSIHAKFAPPWVVKPLRGVGSHNLAYAETLHRLITILEDALIVGEDFLVESFISGREVVFGFVEGMRDESWYSLPKQSVMYHDKVFYRGPKRDSAYRLVPEKTDAEFNSSLKGLIKDFGIHSYTLLQFRETPKGLYFMEIDDLPQVHDGSIFHKLLEQTGVNQETFITHILALAKERKKS